MSAPILRWGPAGAVALGAAIATAHGLYEVAAAAAVPTVIAWLYPLITDGLAVVAYRGAVRLTGRPAAYAWTIVVITAGASGLAQAVFLAAGPFDDAATEVPAGLRFGVGAWPAVAAALVAHLLHLLAATDQDATSSPVTGASPATGPPPVAALTQDEPTVPPAPTPHEEPPTPATTPATGQSAATEEPGDADPRVVELARRLAAGEDLSGPAIGAELEVSDRTGRRLLADARAYLDGHPETTEPSSRPGLHLITRPTSGGTA